MPGLPIKRSSSRGSPGQASTSTSQVSAGAKAFLFALAVVDDIAAVTVIAIAYTSHLASGWLAVAAVGVLAGALLLRVRVLPLAGWGLLGLLGVGVWWAAWRSGLHATIAGVALRFAVPIGVDPAKLAILAASLVAGLLGAAVLFGAKRLPTEQPSRQPTDRP